MCSYAVLPLLFGRSANVTVFDVLEMIEGGVEAEAGDDGDSEPELCERFTRFARGIICCGSFSSCTFEIEGRCERPVLGSCMPRAGRDNDFLRVLYGMATIGMVL